MSRAKRPHFSPLDKHPLLDALGNARHWVIRFSSAQDFHSPQRRICEDLNKAIDALAGELTGDPSYFHAKPHGGGFSIGVKLSPDQS